MSRAIIFVVALILDAASHAQPIPAGEPQEPLLREMCERRAVNAPDDKGVKEAREALRTTFINSCMIVERLHSKPSSKCERRCQERFSTNVCKKERRILTH